MLLRIACLLPADPPATPCCRMQPTTRVCRPPSWTESRCLTTPITRLCRPESLARFLFATTWQSSSARSPRSQTAWVSTDAWRFGECLPPTTDCHLLPLTARGRARVRVPRPIMVRRLSGCLSRNCVYCLPRNCLLFQACGGSEDGREGCLGVPGLLRGEWRARRLLRAPRRPLCCTRCQQRRR